jgi:hypothetical protein
MRRALTFLQTVAVIAAVTGAVRAAIRPSPKFESSAPLAVWKNGGFMINNNEWNRSARRQTIWANSYGSWGVQSDQAVGHAVENYPCVRQYYDNMLVTSFHLIRNGFTESMPDASGVDAEAADDVWLNDHAIEVMIWVENHGQTPAGDIIGQPTIFGQSFAVWHGSSTYAFALNGNETSGVTHILASIQWLMAHGYVPASATLAQVDFGWEIVSAGGSPMNFTMTNYWLPS